MENLSSVELQQLIASANLLLTSRAVAQQVKQSNQLNKGYTNLYNIALYSIDDVIQYYTEEKSLCKYVLITLTFDPKISVNLDEYGQSAKLQQCLDCLSDRIYFACYEKHKSGILHAHIFIEADCHDIQPVLHKMKKYITKSNHLRPSIDIKPIKQRVEDVIRSIRYIVDDKPDHPVFKKLFWRKNL